MKRREEYLRWLKARGYAPETLRSKRGALDRFAEFVGGLGMEKAEEVTSAAVGSYHAKVKALKNARTGEPIQPGSFEMLLLPVRDFFDWLIRRGRLGFNPAAGLTWPRPKWTVPRRVLNEKEILKVMAQADTGTDRGVRDRAMMEVLYSTAIRARELADLELYDVDAVKGVLRVRRGKNGYGRVVPVGREALKWVDVYLKTVRDKWAGKDGQARLFLSCRGKRLTVSNLGQTFAVYLASVGLVERRVCHMFRHACATHMLNNGAKVEEVQRMLGHRCLTSTQIYTRPTAAEVKAAHRLAHPRGGGKVPAA